MGFESQNDWYLSALLGKMGINPNPDYKLSPVYRKAWAMTEAGRLLGEDVTQWEALLIKEVARLADIPKVLEQFRAADQKRLREDPRYQAVLAAQNEIDNALTARLTAIAP